MGLALVPRSARALSEHLNRYYRTLKGIDPDSVVLRLPSGGSFQVQHSVTAAPVFSVTDAGASVSIGSEDLADGAVTSAKILDDTITNVDINTAAAIAVTKLAHVGAGNVLRSTGAANVGGQVVNADVAAAAAIAVSKLAGGGTANQVAATTDGTNVAMAKVTGAMIAAATMLDTNFTANTINGNKIADATITSAKLSGGIAVPAGSITSTELADGGVATADIAPNAITQRTASIPFTGGRTAAGFSDVDSVNGKVTLTTTGGDLLVLWTGSASNASAGIAQQVAVRLDAGGDSQATPAYSYVGNANFPTPFCIIMLFTGVAPGVHSVYARHSNVSATGTMNTTGQMFGIEIKR